MKNVPSKRDPKPRDVLHANWLEEGKQKWGEDYNLWKVVCPSCRMPQTLAEVIAVGGSQKSFGFSCIGKLHAKVGGNNVMPAGQVHKGFGCMYTHGGALKLNPVRILHTTGVRPTFEWAEK